MTRKGKQSLFKGSLPFEQEVIDLDASDDDNAKMTDVTAQTHQQFSTVSTAAFTCAQPMSTVTSIGRRLTTCEMPSMSNITPPTLGPLNAQ